MNVYRVDAKEQIIYELLSGYYNTYYHYYWVKGYDPQGITQNYIGKWWPMRDGVILIFAFWTYSWDYYGKWKNIIPINHKLIDYWM